MNLADEIRALKYGAKWTHQPTLDIVVELVEKREAERAERIKRMRSTVIPAIGSDIRDGWNLAIDHVLESEANK